MKVGVIAFFRQVRSEMAKVTWPVRRETGISAAMVLVMVLSVAVFFHLADWLMSFGISFGVSFFGSLFR